MVHMQIADMFVFVIVNVYVTIAGNGYFFLLIYLVMVPLLYGFSAGMNIIQNACGVGEGVGVPHGTKLKLKTWKKSHQKRVKRP